MSQSPTEAVGSDSPDSLRYRQGWKALNRLLHEDRSFSGGERNCAFLNLEGKGFADISGVSGFDFAEDARAVVATDWDFDGDLDLWLTCRTAPRVRLLKNVTKAGNWVAIKVRGDGQKVNRDAVGAVVEVQAAGPPLVRRVHGGDAFLSQHGSWLHFGLGDVGEVTQVAVHWPGGGKTSVAGVESGGFYEVTFGQPKAEKWTPPVRSALAVAPQVPLPDEEQARIVLPARLPLPPVGRLGDLRGPLLLNVWSAECENCLHELGDWTEGYEEIKAAGVKILALNADPGVTDRDAPFDIGDASGDEVRALDLFQRGVLDRWMPLPVPSSFLIDARGDVAVIYKGRVARAQILEDIKLLEAPPERWRVAALPFPGRFIDPPPKPQPLRVASQLVDAAQSRSALAYLERYAASRPVGDDVKQVITVLSGELVPTDPGLKLLAAADALRDAGDVPGAIEAYKNVLRNSPTTLAAAERLAWLLMDQPGGLPEAMALAERLCAMTKNQNQDYLALREAVLKKRAGGRAPSAP